MNSLPRPDFNSTPSPTEKVKFKTPSPLKEIKIGPTQIHQINRIRSFEDRLTEAQSPNANNYQYMGMVNRQVRLIEDTRE